jgi:ADP-heptose:LPS heptosyltransferase
MIQRKPKGWYGLVRLGSIGDNLMATSVLPLISKDYNIEVIAQEPYHAIFENNPYIDKLSIKKPNEIATGNGMLDWQKWFVGRSGEFAKFINLSHTCESTLALLPAQTQFYWPASARRRLCGYSYLEMVHDVCEVEHDFTIGPRFYPTAEEREKAFETKAKVGKRVIGWCIAGSRHDKIYPYSAMAIARLIKETGLPVVMFGASGKDFELAKIIQEHVQRQNSSEEGLFLALSPDSEQPTWPIRRSLAQVQTCDLVISPDTGPAWAVAMEAMPKIIMLSHASDTNITKHWHNTVSLHADPERVDCWPCHRLHDEVGTCRPNKDNNGAACISDISVETLVTTAKNLLLTKELHENGWNRTMVTESDVGLGATGSYCVSSRRTGREHFPGSA